ncbi:MAG: hypothetical protein JWO08_2832 [Verrucomicrobiaceae bacterium]|nr:hypothetical protein [Verrucomicrobiaceae bacterium]
MIQQDMLWQQVAAFQFDDNQAALTFSQRLARENGWSPVYAGRVVGEYRRFLYLAVRAGHPVTPSDEVDQAWHLHMVYTRSYWDDLCRDVLGQPLHHGPTRGGKKEAHKFGDWYQATLDSYRSLFETEPPVDIWRPAEVRFSSTARFQRVDLSGVWLLPKAQVKALLLATSAVVLGLVLAACESSAGHGDTQFLAGMVVVFGFVVVAAIFNHRNGPPGGRGKRKDSGAGCFSFFGTSGCSSGSSDGGSHSGHSGYGGHSGCGGSSGCGSGGCGGGGCGGGD